MAKTWKQFTPSSGYVDWPAGTSPNPHSLYMPKFLNQFVGWIRYLAAAGGLADGRKTPKWVVDKETIIQYADFWNNLAFMPSSKWLANNPSTFGASAVPYAGEDGYAYALTEADLFASEPTWVQIGDIIHPGAPFEVVTAFVMAARARIDAAQAWVLNASPWTSPTGTAATEISAPFTGITATMLNHEASLYTDDPSWTEQGTTASEFTIDYYINTAAYGHHYGNSYATSVQVAAPNATYDLGATAYVGLHSANGASGTPLTDAVADGSAKFVENTAIGTSAVSVSNRGKISRLPSVPPPADVLATQYLFPVYVAPDTLPTAFQPPDGLP